MVDTIGVGKVVTIHYTLTDERQETIDSSRGGEPLTYLHGANNVVPGLERQLTGRSSGEQLVLHVAPEEGYGQRHGPGPQSVPRTAFPPDADLVAGTQFLTPDPSGGQMPVFIVGVRGNQVLIDRSHPLAGKTLTFDVEVIAIRDATGGEITQGHPDL